MAAAMPLRTASILLNLLRNSFSCWVRYRQIGGAVSR
jgi:hypothetical protein